MSKKQIPWGKIYNFFKDILIPILIPLAVGISSYCVNVTGNKIAETQMLIAKNSYAPVIDIKTYIDEKDNKSITVSILDGRADNLNWEIVTFLDLIFEDYSYIGAPTSDVVQIPMEKYYPYFTASPKINGQTVKWDSASNYMKICELQNDIENTDVQITTRVHSYIRGTYLNILNEEESVYYSITDYLRLHENLYIALMSQKDGEDIFKQYEAMCEKDLCLEPWSNDTLTVVKAFQILSKIRRLEHELQS